MRIILGIFICMVVFYTIRSCNHIVREAKRTGVSAETKLERTIDRTVNRLADKIEYEIDKKWDADLEAEASVEAMGVHPESCNIECKIKNQDSTILRVMVKCDKNIDTLITAKLQNDEGEVYAHANGRVVGRLGEIATVEFKYDNVEDVLGVDKIVLVSK